MGIYRQTVMDLDAAVEDAAEHGQWGRDWLEAEGHPPSAMEGDVVHSVDPYLPAQQLHHVFEAAGHLVDSASLVDEVVTTARQ
ncbi:MULTISPECIES: hypothetical protein [unclassified Streptomyces]|uniref:hypothetical protein n=1 Tax=unclassified Streptomyces TaxID=2593676 RepID=UPI0033F8EA8C